MPLNRHLHKYALLATGFISILMVPLLTTNALPAGFATPWVSLWALRWLCFRIMIGAGMIKIRGDSCWRDLTAMCYHYETQVYQCMRP